MKKAILSSILILSSTTIFAETTMCFKENHQSMTTIESTPLNGGACNGKYTINDMKAKGWNVDDIKISQSANGMNFIYILKTGTNSIQAVAPLAVSGNQADMEARILEKLEKKKEVEAKEKGVQVQKDLAVDGENTYIKKCQTCHGTNGELNAKGYSRPLNTLSYEEMKDSISGYTNGSYDRGMAMLMQPIAGAITYKDLEEVHAYLNKINKK